MPNPKFKPEAKIEYNPDYPSVEDLRAKA